ncbi:flagellar hook-associated protein FlgK [Sporosarcina oncorhynchi]|uniref:Flagellar hook-associated protein 1 n=1 Tax=Sporosarcina oncorhynchi TaxID=3056444 RepID=A0ABZ0L713_9BACL|nr:flagellar hook-associated protein FlgK [Sporosarcina sp. T2O-4]WOV88351.1 flagellar hook-associated protein FlgK [Sporosarcina sp. T2O-4]
MRSTFMGLETNKRGLYTQQSALYTTGHNISNANTPGYSRQRVNMQATAGFPGVGLNTPTMPGFLGTGVEAGSIQRIRDGFVDQQFRGESNKLGYWESRSNAIAQMEDVLAEPSAYGLQQSFSDFWQSLQTLATNPENGGARAVVVERGVAVADSFNYIHKSLSEIQTNLGKEIGVSTKNINSILKQIGELNKQISEVEPNGYMPNDLYDARDNLLDQLSGYLPIEVSYEKSGGRALAIAEGTVTVKIKTNNPAQPFITVVDKSNVSQLKPVGDGTGGTDSEGNPIGNMTGFTFSGGPADGKELNVNDMQTAGVLKSLVNSYGYKDGADKVKGLYPEMLAKLDKMAQEFAKAFNEAHRSGTGTPPNNLTGKNFFEPYDIKNPGLADEEYDYSKLSAGNIIVNEAIINDHSLLAASSEAGEMGNGNNAKKLGEVLFAPLGGLEGSSVQSYYAGVIGELGVQGEQAVKMTKNSMTLLGAVSNRRDSISSVSLDEEMTDMIRFQQAYNASARMITVMDETLDKIINGMGVVGR